MEDAGADEVVEGGADEVVVGATDEVVGGTQVVVGVVAGEGCKIAGQQGSSRSDDWRTSELTRRGRRRGRGSLGDRVRLSSRRDRRRRVGRIRRGRWVVGERTRR